MKQEMVTQVRESWLRVATVGPLVAGLFHSNLRRTNPHFDALFHGRVDTRDIMVVQAFGSVVDAADDLSRASAGLQRLGRLYGCIGSPVPSAQEFLVALLHTFEQVLGEDFTPPLQEAWTEFFYVFMRQMQLELIAN